jgi:hypothetical protein
MARTLRRLGTRASLLVGSGLIASSAVCSGVCLAAVPRIEATSVCWNPDDPYYYAGFYTTNYANEGVEGDINYAQDDMILYNDATDHAALWIGAVSQSDTHEYVYDGIDWLQAGYMVGKADGHPPEDSTVVYAEANDLNDRGNHWFVVFNTGEAGVGGRDVFQALYSLNDTPLATAQLIDPHATQEDANSEAYLGDSSGWCPEIAQGLFGTNGSSTDPSWNSSTELEIYNNDPAYVPWEPSYIATSPGTDPPYHTDTYLAYDAFESYGGGP